MRKMSLGREVGAEELARSELGVYTVGEAGCMAPAACFSRMLLVIMNIRIYFKGCYYVSWWKNVHEQAN